MQPDRKDKKKEIYKSTFSQIEKMHPYKMLLYLVIISTSFIFLFLVLAFSISQDYLTTYGYFRFPRPFIISTIVLLVSSFQISKILNYYKTDNIKNLTFTLGITFLMGIFYISLQYIGWLQLSAQGVIFTDMPNDSYLYVIIGLNIIHFTAGLFFLAYNYYNLVKSSKDPVNNLILFTNPFERMKLELVKIYWHFINILWMATFFYFLFSF